MARTHVLSNVDAEDRSAFCSHCDMVVYLRLQLGVLYCNRVARTDGSRNHKLTDVDTEARTANCYTCGPVSIYLKAQHTRNPWVCQTTHNRAKRNTSYEHQTKLERDYMREAHGPICDICKEKFDKLEYDHDHSTGKFRGWLCHGCNSGLGKFKDNTQVMALGMIYLEDRASLDENQLTLF